MDRRILKRDYFRYSPSETSTINTSNSQIFTKKPREDSVISLLNSYLESNFEVFKRAYNSRYGNGNDIRLVNLGPITITFFSIFKLTTSNAKHFEDDSHTHIISSINRLLTSSRGSDVLSIRFDRSRGRRQDELASFENIKGSYHLRIKTTSVLQNTMEKLNMAAVIN